MLSNLIKCAACCCFISGLYSEPLKDPFGGDFVPVPDKEPPKDRLLKSIYIGPINQNDLTAGDLIGMINSTFESTKVNLRVVASDVFKRKKVVLKVDKVSVYTLLFILLDNVGAHGFEYRGLKVVFKENVG